jgi:uridine kinase
MSRIVVGMGSKSVVDMIEAASRAHFSGLHVNGHMNGLEPSALKETTSASEDIQRQPFVIGEFCFCFHF